MAQIKHFSAVRYARRLGLDLSNLIAPPFDVLDAAGKSALKAKHPNNIVNVDLPHLPPKAAGPAALYEQAHITLQAWLNSGILIHDPRPAFYAYSQSFDHAGRTLHRHGFFCLVRLSPFGQGHVVPHEKTHPGAIADRLALMNATGMQMSPIFGLYSDPAKEIVNLLYRGLGRPEFFGTLDFIRHDLWSITDADVITRITDLMSTRPIYIADGHHRYTTALQYQADAQQKTGRPLPAGHPANWCMFVLVAMQDDGLLILPTHRLVGSLSWFDIDAFQTALGGNFELRPTTIALENLPQYADELLPKQPPHTFGLYDAKSATLYQLRLLNDDLLKSLDPQRSDAWRRLDVAILQRFIFDEVLQKNFAEGREISPTYVSESPRLIEQIKAGGQQLAFLLQPTPLHALEELGRHHETMPPKSTYFYPKLATGLGINPLG